MSETKEPDWRAEMRALCRLILESKHEEELSTHVAVSFLEEDAAQIVNRADYLLRRSQPFVLAKDSAT